MLFYRCLLTVLGTRVTIRVNVNGLCDKNMLGIPDIYSVVGPPLAPSTNSTHHPIPHPHCLTNNYHPWPYAPPHPPITPHPLIFTLLPTTTPNTPQGPHPVHMSPVSRLSSLVSCLLSLVSRLPSPWGGVRLAARRGGG